MAAHRGRRRRGGHGKGRGGVTPTVKRRQCRARASQRKKAALSELSALLAEALPAPCSGESCRNVGSVAISELSASDSVWCARSVSPCSPRPRARAPRPTAAQRGAPPRRGARRSRSRTPRSAVAIEAQDTEACELALERMEEMDLRMREMQLRRAALEERMDALEDQLQQARAMLGAMWHERQDALDTHDATEARAVDVAIEACEDSVIDRTRRLIMAEVHYNAVERMIRYRTQHSQPTAVDGPGDSAAWQ